MPNSEASQSAMVGYSTYSVSTCAVQAVDHPALNDGQPWAEPRVGWEGAVVVMAESERG